MADAQLMEEELQQSAMLSEQAGGDVSMTDDDAGTYTAESQIHVGAASTTGDSDEDDDMGESDDDEDGEDHDDGGNRGRHNDRSSSGSSSGDSDEDDDAFEDDAEGDDDDELIVRPHPGPRRTLNTHRDEEDDDEDEGVGAVKIKPGETEDEDSDSGSSASGSDAESDGEADWEALEQGDGDDDDESEDAGQGECIFCKQDEDHDPAVEFEAFLTCSGCENNAHQQCARENKALSGPVGDPNKWKCPKCIGADSDSDQDVDMDAEEAGIDGIIDTNAAPAERRAHAPKLARDLLPSPKATTKPDSHSVFNQLVLDDDPLDGSRVLRKRKTSSIEGDENVMALRKRRRTTEEQSNDEAAVEHDEAVRPSSRSLRLKIPSPPASIVKKSRSSLVVKLRVNPTELRQILSQKPRPNKKRPRSTRSRNGRSSRGRRTSRQASVPAAAAPITTPFTTTSYSQPFYSFYDKETDELKGKPYGGILTEAEADTSKTMPTNDDRRRFDEAKQKAEEEWRQRLLKMQAEVEVPAKKSKKASGPASQIECIEFGGWEIDTWYAAPYPEEYSRNRVLYICEFCLKYMNSDYVAWRHKLKCPAKHPPGDEIYRHASVSVFEVDGRKNPVYCQNLCLLAKLFLGSKTLYYDVEPFLFYVLCEYDDLGYHFVGYFSKEKRASSQNNVSCILTLPIHQRKGYGNLLIDFSYLLTRVEQKTGSPEKPLSDMGLVSYRNYWRLIMCRYLLDHCSDNAIEKRGLSIKKISDDTGLTPDDVISALEGLRCLVRDPQTQVYAFRVDQQYCREYIAKWEAKGYVQLNPKALTWTPYVMGRSNATNFELGPALNAIAPREEDEDAKPVIAGENLPNGDGTIGQPDPAEENTKMAVETTVLQSTEPSDEANGPSVDDAKPNGIVVNGDSTTTAVELARPVSEGKTSPDSWLVQYKDIPPSRFEVVPPVAGSRRGGDRSRAVVPRPPAVRTATGSSRSRPKRPSGSSRRSTTSKPKSSSNSKRKPGGTGRGPGRWPKGTKKSDYGNADSGPGLPPAWIAERQRQAALVASKKEGKKEDGDVQDTVEVQSPTVWETKASGVPRTSSGGKNGDTKMADADGSDA